jgi:hypothetical protein
MGYLDNSGLFHSWREERSLVDDTIEYLKLQRHYNCPPPGELTDLLYQKWLEIGSVEELEGFYIKPETMLKLRKYERNHQLVIEQFQIEKQLEEEVEKLTEELMQDDLKNQEMFLKLIDHNQSKLDSEWVELRNYYENT